MVYGITVAGLAAMGSHAGSAAVASQGPDQRLTEWGCSGWVRPAITSGACIA